MTITRHAITVFLEVDSDYSDPENLAESVVKHALYNTYGMPEVIDRHTDDEGEHYRHGTPYEITGPQHTKVLHPTTYKGTILRTMETGAAAGNGYLWAEVTSKAFR